MTSSPGPQIQAQIAAIQLTKGIFGQVLSGDLSDQAVLYQAEPSRSHILWLVGHIAWVIDALINPSLGGSPRLPARYHEQFHTGAQPVNTPGAYPSLRELVDAFQGTLDNTVALLESKSEADLAKPLPEGAPLAKQMPQVGALVPFAVFHTGYHSGQISLLRRAQGLPTGLGL